MFLSTEALKDGEVTDLGGVQKAVRPEFVILLFHIGKLRLNEIS